MRILIQPGTLHADPYPDPGSQIKADPDPDAGQTVPSIKVKL
jgi:hypothetical protein